MSHFQSLGFRFGFGLDYAFMRSLESTYLVLSQNSGVSRLGKFVNQAAAPLLSSPVHSFPEGPS
jgi:hypothetical protein